MLITNVTRWSPQVLQVLHAYQAADPDMLAIAGTLGLDLIQLTDLILAIVQKESSGNPAAIGDDGCSRGLMQFNWCAHHSEPSMLLYPDPNDQTGTPGMLTIVSLQQLHDPYIGIAAGTRYLLAMMREFQDVNRAVLAYNAGPGNTYKWITGEIPAPVNEPYLDAVLGILGVVATYFEDLKKKSRLEHRSWFWPSLWAWCCGLLRRERPNLKRM